MQHISTKKCSSLSTAHNFLGNPTDKRSSAYVDNLTERDYNQIDCSGSVEKEETSLFLRRGIVAPETWLISLRGEM